MKFTYKTLFFIFNLEKSAVEIRKQEIIDTYNIDANVSRMVCKD